MSAERRYRGRDPVSKKHIEIEVRGGCVAAVRAGGEAATDVWLTPGLVDLQVNGYGGIDLNDAACDAVAVERLTQRLAASGTTTFLPTIITANQEAMAARLRTIVQARREYAEVAHAVPCIHLEGPSISPLDGYRGAHPFGDVRAPSVAEFEALQDAAEGLVGMVTLSPHWAESVAFICALRERGVVVALGHTHASTEEIRAAVDAGAQLSTHLGNGIATELARHPNPIWTQLAEDRLTATLIADGVHLPEETLRVMLRAKGVERAVLVSDSVGLGGCAPGRYQTPVGGDVLVGEDGSIRMRESGLLAGSGVALGDAVARVAALQGYGLGEAIQMATANPARFVTGERGRLTVDAPADLLMFRWAPGMTTLQIVEVVIQGRAILAQDQKSNAD